MAFWRPGDAIPSTSAVALSARETQNQDSEVSCIGYNPNHRLPLHIQRENLPVFAHRSEILYAVETHQTTILIGETGSGKTTQIPQYLMEANWAQYRMIACTQPRRIAAITIAQRIAQEMHGTVGDQVGYAVRFDEKWDAERTKIKLCTDGILLREMMFDPLLTQYSVIVLDEAHEQSIETDLLLSFLKKIQRQRPELRLVIASATLQVDSLLRFFRSKGSESKFKDTHLTDVVALSVTGRQYPVDIMYSLSPQSDFIKATVQSILKIDENEDPGDILVFLPGQDEIESIIHQLQESQDVSGRHARLLPLPFHGSLPLRMQQQIFLPAPPNVARKVILATNIAETSITIDNIRFVIDSCFTKLAFFNPFTGVQALITTPVSQSSAKQRAGRAGRMQAGKCFRLCTEKDFMKLCRSETIPAVQRTRLERLVLYLLSMGVQDLARFDFVSPPSPEALIRALEMLYALGAIDDQGRLMEPIGRHLAEFPLEPEIGRMLLASVEYHCAEEVLTIASLMSGDEIFFHPRGSKERRAKILDALETFAHPAGDLLTSLAVYEAFMENSRSQEWCEQNCVSFRVLTRAFEVRKQLKRYLKRFSNAQREENCPKMTENERQDAILKSITAGFFANVAKLDANHGCMYTTVRDARLVQLHPSSIYANAGQLPNWIVFHQSILTSAEFIRDISKIDPRWLLEIAPEFYQTRDVSAIVSGDSGDLGLPKTAAYTEATVSKFSSLPGEKPSQNSVHDESKHPEVEMGARILFRKPSASKKPSLPIHIGKSKGGLRSQF
uniref:RNA helicase n=1 Tax=Albugo laibachii Nc14 TaxID=890382 RepID=F0WFL0_9STRA|nr:LOC100004107 protein putative [Albugo laibachii Nc14]CCA23294.1 LOC100004107 protein putative [Albugo laibachii Nc14]|eukprot:CCA23294.1 LOC100004107 protein putative [Albugo laibachii Nc14]